MKKFYLFAATAIALASCTSEDYTGEGGNQLGSGNGEIAFESVRPGVTRGDIYGSAAANLLGNNFIVEGTKGILPASTTTTNVVFDNYLVTYGENTAGKTESNTSNWEYVGVDHSDHMASTVLNGAVSGTAIGRGVDQQTIKYWDYSVPQYDFVAYSTGNTTMVAGATNASAGSVKVTKIDGTNKGYSFTGVNAADLSNVYITDVVTVDQANYGKPVVLKFKNLTAKVRMALYETVPGYSVKEVKFYASAPSITTPAAYTAVAAGTDLTAGTHYFTSSTGAGEFVEPNPAIHKDVAADTYWTLTTAAVISPTPNTTATLYTPAGNPLPTSGTITVSYPHTGITNRDASPAVQDYNLAQVSVAAGSSTSPKQEFSALATGTMEDKEHNETAGAVYLGRTSNDPTFAGSLDNNYYQAVIPNTTGQTLTLSVDYTLVSTDGSNEVIKVYGAKAVVPATYTVWQPNYAYTYIFKISDNTNGSTEKFGGTEGLFPITFDAVVAQTTDAMAEQTTITTVATPSITTYQKGHVYSVADSYRADDGLIYVVVKKSDASIATDLDSKGQLYTVTKAGSAEISEATVMDALLKYTSSDATSTVGRNGITLTNATSATGNSYVGVDGNTVTITGKTNCVASFTATAPVTPATTAYYAYVYKVADATETYPVYQPVTKIADTDEVEGLKYITHATIAAASELAASETADKDYVYFQVTKNGSGTITNYSYITAVPGKTYVVAGTGLGVKKIAKSSLPTGTTGAKAVADTFYFDTYTENNAQYGVKVINVK